MNFEETMKQLETITTELEKGDLNLEDSVKKFEDTNINKNLKTMLDKDIFATNIYTLGYSNDSWSNLDYTKKIIT